MLYALHTFELMFDQELHLTLIMLLVFPVQCSAVQLPCSFNSPSKASCLNDFFGRHCRSEVRSIIKHQPSTIIASPLRGIHTRLNYIFLPALNWMVLSRFFICLQDRTLVNKSIKQECKGAQLLVHQGTTCDTMRCKEALRCMHSVCPDQCSKTV